MLFNSVPLFLLGVAEQFAIAEAKLRAWTSVDEEEMEEESYEEDPPLNHEPITTTLSSGERGQSLETSLMIKPDTDVMSISLTL